MGKTILRHPTNGDVSRLKELWKMNFSKIGLEEFFDNLYKPEYCRAIFDDSNLCSMAYIIPTGELIIDGESFKCAMIYSVATAKEYRGNGYAKEVVERLICDANDMGYPIVVLSPSEDSLFEYYKINNNFIDWFYIKEKIFTKDDFRNALADAGKKLDLVHVSALEYLNLRNRFLKKRIFVKQNKDIIKYQEALCNEVGGGLYKIGDGCAVVEFQDDETILIKELLCDDDLVAGFVSAISEKYAASNYIVRMLCNKSDEENHEKRFGMLQTKTELSINLSSINMLPWYGLALD